VSRNAREGRFVGCAFGKAVRRRAMVPALYAGKELLFPACAPFVDASLAWLTLSKRGQNVAITAMRRRYVAAAAAGAPITLDTP
jgi:hypothetical protein